MLHHVSLGVSDPRHSGQFYDAALSALGYVRVWSHETDIGYGSAGGDDKLALKFRRGAIVPLPGFHLAFAAASRADVDRFHAAALLHGGRDNGLPGLRPEYGPGYYAAFVIDPDGYELEAVIVEPTGT